MKNIFLEIHVFFDKVDMQGRTTTVDSYGNTGFDLQIFQRSKQQFVRTRHCNHIFRFDSVTVCNGAEYGGIIRSSLKILIILGFESGMSKQKHNKSSCGI